MSRDCNSRDWSVAAGSLEGILDVLFCLRRMESKRRSRVEVD